MNYVQRQLFRTELATLTGLEPATSAVTGRRANQLRHRALLWNTFLSEGVSLPGNLPSHTLAGDQPASNRGGLQETALLLAGLSIPAVSIRTATIAYYVPPTGFEPALPP